MLPPGYRSLVIADTRRATEWEEGLRRAGFDVVRVETTGADADKGAWKVAVAAAQESKAKAFVTAVTRGEARLPAPPFLAGFGWKALVGVAVIVGVVLLAMAISRP